MKKAFTVIEIMVVVVIIGLLAIMAVPAFNKVRREADTRAITENLQKMAMVGQAYLDEHGVTKVGYTELVRDVKLDPMLPVAGEDYKSVWIVQGATKLETTARGNLKVAYTDPTAETLQK